MDALILLALALAPGIAIIIYVYLKDKHEREPLALLLTSFLYGLLSVVVTFMISYPVNLLIVTREDSYLEQGVYAFVKVALVEEFSKFIFVRFILFRNKNFNEPFDGIVYSTLVGMGFATLENVLYVYEYGLGTAVMRMFTAVPAHATFAIIMGYFLGRAKFMHRNNFVLSVTALLTATFFHGAYDYFWFIGEMKDTWSGAWIGAVASLVIALLLSRQAIRLHQQSSPFTLDITTQNKRTDDQE